MKRKLGLLGILVAAVALSMIGVLRESTTGSARIPLPVKPVAAGTTLLNGVSTTQLGVAANQRSETTGGHGVRGNSAANYGHGGYGNVDIALNNGDTLGSFLVVVDLLCDSVDANDFDSVAQPEDPIVPPGGDVPYTFDEASTSALAPYLLSQAPPFSVASTFYTDIPTVWILNRTLAYNLPVPIPLNIPVLEVPWNPGTALTLILQGGQPAKPSGQTCSDSSGGVSISETDGTATSPVPAQGNPEMVGDSAGPCDTGATECADKQVHGFWSYPSIVTGSSTAVTLRVLNNGPEATGDFKDVWHVEAPAGLSASWATTVDRKDWNGSAFVDGTDPVVSGGGLEISYDEDNVPVGASVEYTGTLNVSCTTPGDYVVAIKAAAYPKSGTTDNDLSTNVAMSTLRVQCPVSGTLVDKQVVVSMPRITSVSAGSAAINRPADSGPGGEDPLGTHVQLVVGDSATLTFTTVTRNQSASAAAGDLLLVAEAPDLDGNGVYDITVGWDSGSVGAVYGSDPDELLSLATSASCIAGGGAACAGLDIGMTEPAGPQVQVTSDMNVTCAAPGRYLVPVKVIDLPSGAGDPAIANNLSWSAITVYCWASTGDVQDDGIDDNTGIYPRWSTHEATGGNADNRKGVPPYPATGMTADTTYVERFLSYDCYWHDADGTPIGDGWISAAESFADDDIPAGIDNDGDCLADAAFAQPGRPVDEDDQPDSVLCPAIVYNEGKAPFGSVQYDTAADMDCDGVLDGIEKAWGSNPELADTDGDGASDFFELFMFTNPVNPDTDGDGILDKPDDDFISAAFGAAEGGEAANADDNCPTAYNPNQANFDGQRRVNGDQIPGSFASNPNGDKMGDACDPDDDNDAMLDLAEPLNEGAGRGPTNPFNPDSDGDRCLDGIEMQLGKDPNVGTGAGKCPATLAPASQTYWRGCHLNVPDSAVWPDFVAHSGAWAEMDVDGDGINCSTSSITDADSDNGTGTGSPAPDELIDIIEAQYYGTKIAVKDSDGDGCDDWKEIIDMNGNRQAEVTDVMFIAKRAFGLIPASNSDPLLDIDKNGSVQTSDALMAAKNSVLVKPHAACSSEG